MQTCETAVAGVEEEDEGGGVLVSFSEPDFSISLLPINHIHQLLNNRESFTLDQNEFSSLPNPTIRCHRVGYRFLQLKH